MTEPLLSQEEIRDLLRQPAKGPVEHLWDGEAQSFNLFASGSNIEEKLAQAKDIHIKVPKDVNVGWSELSGKKIVIELKDQTVIPGADSLAAISVDSSIVGMWSNNALKLEGALLIDRNMFFALYNTSFSGLMNFEKKGPLTRLERQILDKYLALFSESVKKVWEPYGMSELIVNKVLVEQEEIGSYNWDFDVMRVSFSVSEENIIKEGEEEKTVKTELGLVEAVLPKELLDRIGKEDAVESVKASADGKVDQAWYSAVRLAVSSVPVDVEVELGEMTVQMRDVLNLQSDSVYQLEEPQLGFPVKYKGKTILLATMGHVEDRRGIQIKGRVYG